MLAAPLLALALLIQTPARPAESAPSRVVSVEWLAQHLQDRHLVVLHVGPKVTYQTAHVPGARHAYLMDLHNWDPLSLEMPAPDALREKLAALGIGDDSRVVVYPTSGAITSAARLMLLLEHAGIDKVHLLQGGLVAWIRAGHPSTAEVPATAVGALSRLKKSDVVVDSAFVTSHVGKPGFVVVDARSGSFYDGIEVGGDRKAQHKAGHITGAVSIPYSSVQQDDGLKAVEELRRIFTAAGVKPGDAVIGYCHIGQQVSSVLLAAEMLGHKVFLYDGSFEDWSRRGLPVQTADRDE